jgi:hypothetical protein
MVEVTCPYLTARHDAKQEGDSAYNLLSNWLNRRSLIAWHCKAPFDSPTVAANGDGRLARQ